MTTRAMLAGAALALGLGAAPARAAAQRAAAGPVWPADSAAVRVSLARFLTAFENLDWAAFSDSFDSDASAFFPVPEPPDRADGKAAVLERFRRVFDEIRAAAPSGPPYMRLDPQHLRVEQLGPGLVLVTFELDNAQRVARRSIVFRQRANGWKILHLHASNTPRQ